MYKYEVHSLALLERNIKILFVHNYVPLKIHLRAIEKSTSFRSLGLKLMLTNILHPTSSSKPSISYTVNDIK